MQLTTEYRDEPSGLMTGDKSFYLVCTVTLSEEEKAIAQERGLYRYSLQIEQDVPGRSSAAILGTGVAASVGQFLLLPLGGLIFLSQTFFQYFYPPSYVVIAQLVGFGMMAAGGFLWFYMHHSDNQYEERKAYPYKRITLGEIIAEPTFIIEAATILQLREHEASVREQLKSLVELIRQSAPIGESNTYEL